MIDAVALEREFARMISAIVGKPVDDGVFRGLMPETSNDAICVRLTDDSVRFLETPEYTIQVLGRFADRDDALAFLSLMRQSFPAFGRSIGGFSFPSIVPQDAGVQPYTFSVRGNTMHFVSFNLRVRVLTSRA
ncbi:MAG: hypothetical protein J5654_09695 [Victivallales bacterium]|nr:hypothetical protein [Victivallales bacterium]